eukprot:Skav205759  [mRNA]  locus=scaffold1714:195689:202390:- [translate_table: standard]
MALQHVLAPFSPANQKLPSTASMAEVLPCPECKSSANLVPLDTAVYCRACSTSRCLSCNNMWNADHRCGTAVALSKAWEGFKDLAAFELQLKPMGFKRCPACQYPCEKADPLSCDHITCECGHQFCWNCGEDRRVIYAHDLSYHHPRCKFYVPCDETPKLEKILGQLGLYMKNWRKAEERDAALVTEKSEGLGSRYGGHVPFGEVFSQMLPGGWWVGGSYQAPPNQMVV